MAGDWIPMRLDLPEDPAVLEMADILGESEEYVVGCLHKVWSWASRQCHCGTVTGVTVMSLSRAVKLPKAVDAMVQVGWLIGGVGDDGRPFVTFPKWENWLSMSAKTRIKNSINQRNSRSAKNTAVNHESKTDQKTVTEMSLARNDKTVTTVQESTVEKINTLSPSRCKHSEMLSSDVICPDWLVAEFCRWLAFRFARDSRQVDPITQEAWIKDLVSRGQTKALTDIDFSIRKQAKNLIDSNNDFDKQTRPAGGQTSKTSAKETPAEKTRKMIEDIKNGLV